VRRAGASPRKFQSHQAGRELDPGNLGTLGEINHGKSIKARQLNENAARRTIGIAFKGHGAHTAIQFKLPRDFVGLKIHYSDGLRFDGAADGVLAVGVT